MDSSSRFLVLFVFCCLQQNGLASFSTSLECTLQYDVEYGNGHITISPRWKVESSCGHDQVQSSIVPDLTTFGAQPFVQLSTCSRRAVSPTSSISIGHTLLTLARDNHTTCFNSTNGCSLDWTVEIPDYLSSGQCIEVWVKSSLLGSGIQIDGTKLKIWTSNDVSTDNEGTIISEEGYEVMDAKIQDGTRVVLLRKDADNSFELHHSNDSDGEEELRVSTLPTCVSYQEEQFVWKPIFGNFVNESCDEEGSYTFNPTGVIAVSKMELFVFGNGLLFSPNRGMTMYSLTTPWRVLETTSFAVSIDNAVYALISKKANQTGSIVSEIWLGYVGRMEVFPLYPSALCDAFWQSLGQEWEDPTLTNTTLQFDVDNNLFMVTGSLSLKIPLSLLVVNEGYKRALEGQSVNCITPQPQAQLNQYQRLYQIGFQYHPLTWCATARTCPYTEKVVRAPSCEKLTRNKFHITEEGELQRLDKTTIAELNCSISSSRLPGDVFLDKSQQYSFVMEFMMDVQSQDLPTLTPAVKIAVPEALRVIVEESYRAVTNSLLFQVTLQELQSFSGQIESGSITTSVDVSLYIAEVGTECLDPLSTSIQPPGYTHTRVHIGCPPGLSVIFDANTTSSVKNQFCTLTPNISCFYFGNKFYPTFLMVDSVTEERQVFTSSYTLRAVAGGDSEDNMTPFLLTNNVEIGIWTPVNESKKDPVPVYRYGDNGITWLCSTTSPCGEKIPGVGRSPEYYLLLEASNMMVVNDTYCALSVQFLIKIHGLSMGGITTVVSVITFTIICCLIVLLMFVLWHYRLKFLYMKDILMDKWNGCWPDNRDKFLVLLRKHRGKINPTL